MNIAVRHFSSFRNIRNQTIRPRDVISFVVIPLITIVLCIACKLKLSQNSCNGLLTVAGLLSAFLFGLVIQILDRAESWADQDVVSSRDTIQHANDLQDLAANAAFASIVCFIELIILLVTSCVSGRWLVTFSSIGIGTGVFVVSTLLMILNRVYGLIVSRTLKARTSTQ